MEKNKIESLGASSANEVHPAAVGRRSPATSARRVALVGIMAATIECGKLALAAIPNVEVVTLLCALFGYVFGLSGVLAVCVFVCIEPMIWGFGPWVISYFLYWPTLAALFWLIGRRSKDQAVLPTVVAVAMTVLFGVLSSLVEVGLFSGSLDRFFYRFGIYYIRGIWFYVIQTATNAVLFPTLFRPLAALLRRASGQKGNL